MLSCVLTDIDGNEKIAPYPLSMTVDVDENIPADALKATFPYFETSEIARIDVYADGEIVFRGIVDEEEHTVDSGGEYLKIAARSKAALLLDNEAMPCVYDHPSADMICERYAEPFGIRCADSDDAVYFGEQTIAKGSSCWSVLKNFCNACYSTLPRIGSDGLLRMKGISGDKELRFGSDGIRYTRISELNKRSAELSAVRVKTESAGGYELCVTNEIAVSRGIRRERYLNALLTESPMRCADAMLRNGRSKAYALKLRCPECLLGAQGCSAEVYDAILGSRKGLYVSSLRYHSDADGEYTDLMLKRRNV